MRFVYINVRHPIAIDGCECIAGGFALWRLKGTNEHAIRVKEIFDGRPFCKELWI